MIDNILLACLLDVPRKKERLDILHDYLLFPLSQSILLVISVLFIERHAKGAVSTGYSLALLLAILLCVVADVFLFRSIKQLMEKAAAEERAGWFDYLLEQQELYYEQYQADLEDASRIRHDIRNQLQTAYTLMEQHDGPGGLGHSQRRVRPAGTAPGLLPEPSAQRFALGQGEPLHPGRSAVSV